MEKILALLVHSLVHTSPIFNYGIASDPPSPLHDSTEEIVTPRVNPKQYDNPPDTVPNVSSDPDSDPSFSDSSLSESYESSDDKYYKLR